MSCVFCHEPHWQDQRIVYGPASYASSGTSDPGGITANSLTKSGAGWQPNSLTGMVLFPNITQPSFSYKIVGNTSDTIMVNGPMNLVMTTTGNSTFAVMYGKLISGGIVTPNSGPKAVRFFGSTGVNSFADGDTTYDGVCEVCHTQTTHHRNNGLAPAQSHYDGTNCTGCHSHASGFGSFDHAATNAVRPVASCLECHGSAGPDLIVDVHDNQCELCHVNPIGGGPLFEPFETNWPQGGYCTDCHGSLSTAHSNVSHTATFASGPVQIFENDRHTTGSSAVLVDCGICHSNNLSAVHGNDCATCHPTPYNTLDTWNGGCQQGGCHFDYHQDATWAHSPYEDSNGSFDCNLCHEASWNVPQSGCLNCHTAYEPGDIIPPVTVSDAKSQYVGPAKINFSVKEDGKVGVGRTFYRLDSGPVTAAGKDLSVAAPGMHTLEFWSMDQTGNTEAPTNVVVFNVIQDTTPPTTRSNALSAYNESALITLTALDNGTLGAKTTYFRLNDGPIQTGTSVVILPATIGTFSYTLDFWSDDWSGNSESEQSVGFTVTVSPPPEAGVPASLTVPASSTTGSFTVSWGASATTSVTYVLERSDNGGAFNEVYRGTARSLAVSGLTNGSYAFRVKALRSGYTDSAYTTSGTCVVTLPVVSAPVSITVPATDTDGAFPVSWTASSTIGVTYKLERSLNNGQFVQVYSGTALTTTVSGMNNGSYVFRVKATRSGHTDSAYTTAEACLVTLTAVEAPGPITVPATDTDGAFPVSWTASPTSGVTYKLERATDGGAYTQVYSGTATSYNVSNLTDGSYAFRVKATKSGFLDSAYTAPAACAVTVTTVQPPVSIAVPATSTVATLTVSWEASPTSEASYVLERSLNGGAFGQVYSGTALTATVTGMSNGSNVFRVKAAKSGFVSSGYVTSTACVVTLTATPPPTITVPETDSDGAFPVSWTASSTSGVTYVLERSSDDGETFTEAYSGTALSSAVSGLPDGSYLFRVKATRSDYLDSGYTTSTPCTVAVTTVGAPASISGVPLTSTTGSFPVSWPASATSGVTYKLERSIDGGTTYTQVYSGTATTYNVSNLANGSYLFRVKATLTGSVDSPYATSEPCVVLLTAGTPASITVPATDLDGVFTVSWGASATTSVTYVLDRSDNGGAFNEVYRGTARSLAVSGLVTGIYEFQVKAIRTGYEESGYQSGSCEVTVMTVGAPASISGVPATSTTGSFPVSWAPSATAGVTYKLERSTNGGAFSQVYSGTATTYNVSNLANGSYLFRVKATLTGSVDSPYATSEPCVVTLTAGTPASITVPATDLDGVFTVSWGASATTSVTYVLERSDNGGAFTQVYSGTARSLAVSGLLDGSYTFRVKAIRTGYEESGYQSGACLVTVTTVGAPASISGVPLTSTTGSFTVTWPASSTAAVTYKLERSTDGGTTYTQVYSGTATTYNVSNLANGSYLFRVKATLTGSVDSPYAISATCVVTLTAGTPASITVPATDLDGVFTVSWGASATTSVTYVLERSDNGGAFTQVYSGTARSLAVSGLLDGSYTFRVKAIRTGYEESGYQSGACLVTVTTVGAPASISGVPLTSTTGSFTVTWPASSTAAVTYKLERSTNSGAFAVVYSGTATSYTASNLANGNYVFRVKATLAGSVDSDYATSGTCVVTLTVATPASITVPATDLDGAFSVSWAASTTSSVTYVLERSDNGAPFAQVYSGTARSLAVSGLANGSYAFRVKAIRTGYVESGYQSGTCLVQP